MTKALEPCPDSPNCVSTMADATDQSHYIEPMSIDNASGDIAGIVVSVLESAGADVTQQSPSRIEAVFTSRLMRFKDDVVFVVDSDVQLLHARSSSRVGHSDLGANRKRLTMLFEEIGGQLR